MGQRIRDEDALLDGASLTVPLLESIARGEQATVERGRFIAVERAHRRLVDAREHGAVYGANTGVGANRNVRVRTDSDAASAGDIGGDCAVAVVGERAGHARRLLLSHCTGVGPVEDDALTRAAMTVRLNQFLAGGSGISVPVVEGLRDALASDSLPTLHRLGAIGMGDLPQLAELALTLGGDRPWRRGGIAPVVFTDSDSLPFMSSSAVTLAAAALGSSALRSLQRSAVVVAALSLLALEGSREAYDDDVHRRRNVPCQREVAAAMRRLTGMDGPAARDGARIQDPFGLRVFPQVHAPALDALNRLDMLVEAEMNAAVENPLVISSGVAHNGQFHLAAIAAALDNARTALFPTLTLSAARLGMLFRPDLTGLRPFLAHGDPGSSGLMVGEYVVQDVLATLRSAVVPVSGGTLSISLGLEDHAGFATQGARLLRCAAAEAPTVVAVEALAAVRALRLVPDRLVDGPAREAFEYVAQGIDPAMEDRPMGEDIARVVELLPGLGRFLGADL